MGAAHFLVRFSSSTEEVNVAVPEDRPIWMIMALHSTLGRSSHAIQGHCCRFRRGFAVKALSWCSGDAPRPKHEEAMAGRPTDPRDALEPIQRFGIVAAMSSNRVIGINGKLPWRLPKDRKAFKTLTEDKILIIGRRTFEENPLRRHINHARASVVISKTLDSAIEDDTLKVARSFPEALHRARLLAEEHRVDMSNNAIPCWVAGGERVYHEALLHPNALELHLTVVDNEIRIVPDQQPAHFPANYRWDNKFKLIDKVDDIDGGMKFSRSVYERLKGRR